MEEDIRSGCRNSSRRLLPSLPSNDQLCYCFLTILFILSIFYYLKIFDSFNMGSRKLAEEIIEQIKKREKIQETSIQKLCELAKEILKS